MRRAGSQSSDVGNSWLDMARLHTAPGLKELTEQ
jgi:hypothetical protein